MEELVVIGAGGHAKMVIEAARSRTELRVVACLDLQTSLTECLGVRVFEESDETIDSFLRSGSCFFVALGDNRLREKITKQLVTKGCRIATIIAASATVSPSASIGEGTVVMPKATIGASARVGKGAIVNTASSIDHDTLIEDFVHIAPGCHLAGNVKVDAGSMLGIGTCVVPSIHIGAWATLGANSTVIRDVPSHSTWVGSPARCIRMENGSQASE
jgi:sugar O-acyltransferase (sialic acid O-acetyltransferase NeuD family)